MRFPSVFEAPSIGQNTIGFGNQSISVTVISVISISVSFGRHLAKLW